MHAETPITVIEARQPGIRARARELWAERAFLTYFGRRYLEKRYARTWLGKSWLVLRPLLTVVSQAIAFGAVLGVGSGDVPYLVFFLVSIGAWQLFAQVVYWATRSLELSRAVLRRAYVPRLTILVAAVIPSLVDYAVYVAMGAVVVLYYVIADGQFALQLGLNTLAVPAGLLLLVLLGLVIGLWTSIYGVRARDIRFGVAYVMSFWYFLTPVIYPIEAVPERYRIAVELNPATAPIELVKIGALGEGVVSSVSITVSLAVITTLGLSGLWYFIRSETAALDGV